MGRERERRDGGRTVPPVVVDGWGPLALETVSQLRRLGVHVRGGAHAADAAELEAVGDGPAPALVVLVAADLDPPWRRRPSMVAPWHLWGVPYLPVLPGGDGVVVGPLVVPGVSPCLGCTADAATGGGSSAPGPDGALVLAAAVITVTALGVLRGDTALAGISTEIGEHGTTVTHRVWTSRHECQCLSATMAG